MKKILLTTTALAFAGSAFAATVSGSVTTKYFTSDGTADKTKSFTTSGEVVISGSKTSSSGLTFGGTYKVKVGQALSSYNAGVYTRATPSAITVRSSKDDGSSANRDGMTVTALAEDGKYTPGKFEQTKSEVSGFVSGSWGRVDVGAHKFAKDWGGFDNKLTNAVSYTTPTFSGFSGMYSYSATDSSSMNKALRGFGVQYASAFSGVDFSINYANGKYDGKSASGWKLSGGMSGVTVDYLRQTDVDSNQLNSWSVKYEASNWDVKYANKEKMNGNTKGKETVLTANYTVTEGLKITVEDKKQVDDFKKTYIGTKISF